VDSAADNSGTASNGRSKGRRKHLVTKKPLPVWQETLLLVGTAVILALIIKTFFVQAFYIPSGSMRDTLKINDRILVEKVSYWFGDIHRGDIVVFDDPANWLGEEDGEVPGNPVTKTLSLIGLYPTGGHLVKRVIGIGGDTVSCSHGELDVNGVPLEEADYVTLPKQSCTGSGTWEVPDGHLWVMGDNREHSADSRAHTGDPGGGFIPTDDVVGKVFVVIWPMDRWQFIHRPATFGNAALDDAAGLISGSAPAGLALVASPPLYWGWRTRRRRGPRPRRRDRMRSR
jgi:signal peptidase I